MKRPLLYLAIGVTLIIIPMVTVWGSSKPEDNSIDIATDVNVDAILNVNQTLTNYDTSTHEATSSSVSDAAATANAEGGAGGTGGKAEATGGSNVLTIKSEKQAPSMGTASIFSSHSCAYGRSGSLAVAGFGIGGGGQKIDPGCEDREWSRIMYSMGLIDEARELACMSPSGQKLASCNPPAVVTYDETEIDQLQADLMYYDTRIDELTARFDEERVQIVDLTETVQHLEQQPAQMIYRIPPEVQALIDADADRRTRAYAALHGEN